MPRPLLRLIHPIDYLRCEPLFSQVNPVFTKTNDGGLRLEVGGQIFLPQARID